MNAAANQLRQAIGHFATGVTVITSPAGMAGDGAPPAGTTANAVASLSLDPPLLLVCLDRRSATLDAIRECGAFAVNVLAADQRDVSTNFARPGSLASWAGVDYELGATGSPLLTGALAGIECELERLLDGGDHEILIGRVLTARVSAAETTQPLLYWRGDYAGLERPPVESEPIGAGRSDIEAIACELPTRGGEFRVVGLTGLGSADGDVVVALVHGDPAAAAQGPVHVHVACLLGDTFRSLLCDCRDRLEVAAEEIVAAGAGVIVYAKPVLSDPFRCSRGHRVDPAAVSELLVSLRAGADNGRDMVTIAR